MKKKIMPLILFIITILCLSSVSIYANESGKTIVINMNRTNIEDMNDIPTLQKELEQRGYIALMNVRGDGGNSDKRAYATIGSGRRANVVLDGLFDFSSENDENEGKYESTVNEEPKAINNISINKMISYNLERGQYGATLGTVGQTLADNNYKVAAIGNADTGTNPEELNRDIGLMAMDNLGRIELGNVDDINVVDPSMPFGIRTDYDKLLEETKTYYNEADVIFIELGDTNRLDLYKEYLNDDTFESMRDAIYENINTYLEEVFDLVDENDNIYILSPYPSKVDYQNRKRLSPVIKFDGEGKGLLYSPTTRRDGVIGNVDIGVDILNNYGLESNQTVGKSFTYVEKEDNIEYLDHEFEKMVTIATIRGDIITTFITVVAASWVITMALLLLSKKIPKEVNRKVFVVSKELIKLGMIMPLSFVVAPIFNFKTPNGITAGIIGTIIVLYLLGSLIFRKDDLKQMSFYATLTVLIVVIDCLISTPLMKNSIMSYDAIVGARYYGMGNEYQGIIIGSALFAFTSLLMYDKIRKWMLIPLSIIVLIATASPTMGANVGASISESVAFLTLILLVYNMKIDFKKIVLIGLAAVGVVGTFATIDIITGSESHLSLFIGQILSDGPSAIIETFSRKISMNMQLARTSMWVNILLAGVVIIVSILLLKPNKGVTKLTEKYPLLYKGFIANIVGCGITLLVNDSGIVAASTASIYILIPLVIITVNMAIFNEQK